MTIYKFLPINIGRKEVINDNSVNNSPEKHNRVRQGGGTYHQNGRLGS